MQQYDTNYPIEIVEVDSKILQTLYYQLRKIKTTIPIITLNNLLDEFFTAMIE